MPALESADETYKGADVYETGRTGKHHADSRRFNKG